MSKNEDSVYPRSKQYIGDFRAPAEKLHQDLRAHCRIRVHRRAIRMLAETNPSIRQDGLQGVQASQLRSGKLWGKRKGIFSATQRWNPHRATLPRTRLQILLLVPVVQQALPGLRGWARGERNEAWHDRSGGNGRRCRIWRQVPSRLSEFARHFIRWLPHFLSRVNNCSCSFQRTLIQQQRALQAQGWSHAAPFHHQLFGAELPPVELRLRGKNIRLKLVFVSRILCPRPQRRKHPHHVQKGYALHVFWWVVVFWRTRAYHAWQGTSSPRASWLSKGNVRPKQISSVYHKAVPKKVRNPDAFKLWRSRADPWKVLLALNEEEAGRDP